MNPSHRIPSQKKARSRDEREAPVPPSGGCRADIVRTNRRVPSSAATVSWVSDAFGAPPEGGAIEGGRTLSLTELYAPAQASSSSSPPSTSLTLGSFLISRREIFHAR